MSFGTYHQNKPCVAMLSALMKVVAIKKPYSHNWDSWTAFGAVSSMIISDFAPLRFFAVRFYELNILTRFVPPGKSVIPDRVRLALHPHLHFVSPDRGFATLWLLPSQFLLGK